MSVRVSHFLIKFHLIPLCYYVLRLYLSLLKIEVIGEDAAYKHYVRYGRVIAALWHQRLLPALAYVTKFRRFKPMVIISRSRDGELIASLAERLGVVPVRGSSTRGGREALMALLRAFKANPAAIHIVDGPTGPKGVVKPGLIGMAQVSRAVILPIIVSAEKAWIAGSWDRFLVPKPFSKVTIRWGQPFLVPRNINGLEYKTLKEDIENRLTVAHAEADLSAGWKEPL